jgi:hypothetical protein
MNIGKLRARILKSTVRPPISVARAAKRGLDLRKKFKRGGTPVGVKRAVQLSRRDPVSVRTLQRMVSYFARHAVDKRPGWDNPKKPSNGFIAWLLWGGDPGRKWANRQLERFRKMELDNLCLEAGKCKMELSEIFDASIRLGMFPL